MGNHNLASLASLSCFSRNSNAHTVESRFLEPPREKKLVREIGFEKSKVASKDAKLLRGFFASSRYCELESALIGLKIFKGSSYGG